MILCRVKFPSKICENVENMKKVIEFTYKIVWMSLVYNYSRTLYFYNRNVKLLKSLLKIFGCKKKHHPREDRPLSSHLLCFKGRGHLECTITSRYLLCVDIGYSFNRLRNPPFFTIPYYHFHSPILPKLHSRSLIHSFYRTSPHGTHEE